MGKQNKSEEEGDQTLRLISDLICKVYRSKSFQVPKCTGDYQSSKMYRSKLFQNALRKKKYVGCKIYQEKKSTWVASVVARFIKKKKVRGLQECIDREATANETVQEGTTFRRPLQRSKSRSKRCGERKCVRRLKEGITFR